MDIDLYGQNFSFVFCNFIHPPTCPLYGNTAEVFSHTTILMAGLSHLNKKYVKEKWKWKKVNIS